MKRRSKRHVINDEDVLIRLAVESIPDRIGHLTPSSSFDEVWQRHQLTLEGQSNHYYLKMKKRVVVSVSAIVIALVCIVTAGFISPEVRAAFGKFPFIKMLLEDGGLEEQGLSRIEKQDLGVPVNQSVTDKDIQFTMDEVFYDGIQIVLNYDVKYLHKKGKITDKDSGVYYTLHIIGARPNMISTHKFSIVGDSTFMGSTLIDAYQYLDGYQLQMDISKIGQTKGNWTVKVPLSVVKTDPQTKTFFPNKSFMSNNNKMTVERITMTPVTTQVVITSNGTGPDYKFNFGLRDDLQTQFTPGGGLGGSGEYIGNFGPPPAINPEPQFVSIMVYNNSRIDGSAIKPREETMDVDGEYPLIMKGQHGGIIKINKVDFLDDETIVYYEASDAKNQAPFLQLIDLEGPHPKIGQPVRTSRDRFLYQMKFPKVNHESPIRIQLNVNEYVAGQEPKAPIEVKIPLDWTP